MSEPVISVRDLSKAYEIYARPMDVIKDKLIGGRRCDIFWALRGVSFEVKEKQRLGIIGPNGAGKSTLLKIISGNLQPTSGDIAVRGKISALLSIVPAWNSEETGVQNIEFNLLLQGCAPAEIPSLTEEIIDFTELGPFIYQPAKTYSDGMCARLSFAIATAISPGILIIDEVLGAGDSYFAVKAAARMKEMCERGRAMLLVSHAIASIRQMCDTAIWLENGGIRMAGEVERVAAAYEEDAVRKSEETEREGNRRRLMRMSHVAAPEEIDDHGLCRFRVRADAQVGVRDTHYVRELRVSSAGNETVDLPLEFADLQQPGIGGALELSGCEWGRTYIRKDVNCRILAPRTGARKGGHFVLKRPARSHAAPWDLEVRLVSSSINHAEKLGVEYLDLASGRWQPMTVAGRESLQGDWEALSCKAVIPAYSAEQRSVAVERAALALRPAAQITGISVLVGGEPGVIVNESQAFVLRVGIRYNEPVPASSININITRTDGVYAFYQPSGLDGRNIENFVGDATVDFDFSINPFGAGEYSVNVFVCNGWSWDNVPPSEIFDRSMGVFRFTVRTARPITFGVINTLVPVRIDLRPQRPGS